MKNKLKTFFTDPFNWDIIAAILDTLCTGIFIWKAKYLLAIIWALCTGTDIVLAYIELKKRRK